jgi:hypothetical protein
MVGTRFYLDAAENARLQPLHDQSHRRHSWAYAITALAESGVGLQHPHDSRFRNYKRLSEFERRSGSTKEAALVGGLIS